MPALDVLPDAHESREFKRRVSGLVAAAKSDDRDQKTKFEDLARELEADEDEARFEEMVKKVAKARPKPDGGEEIK